MKKLFCLIISLTIIFGGSLVKAEVSQGIVETGNPVIADTPTALDRGISLRAASSYDSAVKLQERTKQEIINKSRELQHFGNSPWYEQISMSKYLSVPSTNFPYEAGVLTSEFLQDGLNAVNMIRYIAGYPDDILLSDELTDMAQHGAVVLGANDLLTHYPTRPQDMSDDFYSKGYQATSRSNIAQAWGYEGQYFISKAILGFMDDSDSSNIDRVGHRRWLLNPGLQYVGLGYAQNSERSEFVDNYVFDQSRSESIAYDLIAWPAKGVFPIEYFDAAQAWSVNLSTTQYVAPQKSQVQVNLKRLRDDRTWHLDSSVPSTNRTSSDKDYFNVENSNYGQPNCIIFRPGDVGEYASGDCFEITITGIEDRQGNPTQIHYYVDFFSLNDVIEEDPANREEIKAFIERLYARCLGRSADEEGITYWTDKLTYAGFTASDLVKSFIYSEEFINNSLSEDEYMDVMYRVFFDREADEGGKTYWISKMNKGITRDYILAGFIHSAEFENLCTSYGIERGEMILTSSVDVYPDITEFTFRFYEKCMDRKPDREGLNYWVSALANQTYTGVSLANSFINSPEFINKGLSDEEYIVIMYRVFFDREADAAGKEYWMNELSLGRSKENIGFGFIYSDEFRDICSQYGIRYTE